MLQLVCLIDGWVQPSLTDLEGENASLVKLTRVSLLILIERSFESHTGTSADVNWSSSGLSDLGTVS